MTAKLWPDRFGHTLPLKRCSVIVATIALTLAGCASLTRGSFSDASDEKLLEVAARPEPAPPECVEVLDGCAYQRLPGENPSSDVVMAWENQCRARSCEVQRMGWKAQRDHAVAEIERRAQSRSEKQQ